MINSNQPLHPTTKNSWLLDEYISAYILVKAVKVNKAKAELLKIPEVIIAHKITGPMDIILYIEASSMHQMRYIIDVSIRGLIDRSIVCDTYTELVYQEVIGKGYSKNNSSNKPLFKAWVYIKLNVCDYKEVLNKVINLSPVINAHAVIGNTDIIALVETNKKTEILDFLDHELTSISEIKSTDTKFVIDSPSQQERR